jgi:hypothetical protein
MSFARVTLPPDRQLNKRASQTLLRHYTACPRSGFLYQLHRGESQSIELVRGSALHRVCERATEAMITQGESTIPPELVKVIVNEVLADYRVPWSEHDYIREMSYRWATEAAVDPRAVIACETLLTLELGGWAVRGKVDFAEARSGGQIVYVQDLKSARAAPAFEDIARKRSADGRWAAKSFQLVIYALLLAFGRPVRTTLHTCDSCDGNGFWGGDPGESKPCTECHGSGILRGEVVEPFPLAGHAERFDLELVYPGIEDSAGLMLRRPVSVTRLELAEYMDSLSATLSALEASERAGDWPAIQSDEACSECPCRPACPIPLELRDHRGEINTPAQAREAAEILGRRKDDLTALQKELRAWVKANGGELRYGRNKVMRFKLVESDRIADKRALWDAVARASDYGEPFNAAEHVTQVKSSNFVSETLNDAELAEAPA